MKSKHKNIQVIFIIYWCMLAYIIAALIFWFISLNSQHERMISYKMKDLDKNQTDYQAQYNRIQNEKSRKTTQYIGEGISFFLVILAGAIYIHRSVRRQLKETIQQQNFMMAITHELKTPIAVAQLNLETLQKRKLDESQQQRLIQNTLQETVRLNALCNNMLLSSQIDAGGYRMTNEELNLTELVNNCTQEFQNRFPNKEIIKKFQEDIFVNGDELLLQMAINNLLDNSIKYSPKSTPLKVAVIQSTDVCVEIRDEGTGIENKDKQKVFEKFYRAGNAATKSAKGTGLGLYLTFRVINAHNGSIEITDNTPAGTVITIKLKAADKTMS